MSTKVLFRILISSSLLVVVFLAVQALARTSASAPAGGDAMPIKSLVGSDWIERHPAVVPNAASYAGSDWIERHPSAAQNKGSYAGSDWIERHPQTVLGANYFVGSDWIERHPSENYTGSDWIERHPG